MKRALLFLLFAVSIGLTKAQNLIVATTDAGGTATVQAIANGATLDFTTTAANILQIKIRFLNNNSSNGTYSVRRKVITLNPNASTYFCFGSTCFAAPVDTPTSVSDYVTLIPTQWNQGFLIDLDESPSAIGYSLVRYKLYNVNNANDTCTFYIRYNNSLSGIKTNSRALTFASEFYPNPTSSDATMSFNLSNECNVKMQVFNLLGSVVYSDTQSLTAGKNKLKWDCSQFPTGTYYAVIQAGESIINRKIVVKSASLPEF